jgi:hypothetical protein
MLPDTYNIDALRSQPSRHKPVTERVPMNLFRPKHSIVRGRLEATRATVPKAAIQKDCDAALCEIDVGAPKNIPRA